MLATKAVDERNVFDAIATEIQSDAGAFAHKILQTKLWKRQIEVLESARKYTKTLVMSGHGVGKTHLLACLIIEFLVTHPNSRVVVTASNFTQVHDTIWAQVKSLARQSIVPLGGRMMDASWAFPDGSLAKAVTVDDPTSLQGIHSPHVLVVVDEAEGVAQGLWGAIDSLLSSEGSRLVVCFNPVTPSGYLFDAAQNHREWNVINISCLEHPNVVSGKNLIRGAVTRKWVEEKRASEGEDSPFWAARVLGRFPDSGSNTLVSMSELFAAESDPDFVGESRRIGLDVARFGGDRNVLVVFDERRTLTHVESWTGEDLMQTAGRLINAIKRFKVEPRHVGVDVCGIGAGVVDRLKEAGLRVAAVDFGSAPVGDWGGVLGRDAIFPNRRSELHAVVRALVRAKQLVIPAKYKEVCSDITALKYWYDGKGRFVIEPKEEARARLRRSPDFSDAVVIAMGAMGTRRPMIQ